MAEIEYTIEINPITNYTIELNEQGPQGARGYDGVGISSIDETSSQGLVDTYTITLDDGRTSNFDVTNGFSPTATVTKEGTVATITITDENGTTTAEVYDGNGSVDDVRLNEVSVVSDGVADIYVANTYNSSSTAPISGMGVADAGFITGIDSSDVTTALGYTPANDDLSNLSATGQDIIDSKADVDLSNLSSTGQGILDNKLNRQQITNCLLEVPNNIKLSVSEGTVTLEQGSIVIIPFGTTDLSETYPVGSTFINDNLKVVEREFIDGKFFVWAELQADVSRDAGAGSATITKRMLSLYFDSSTINLTSAVNDASVTSDADAPNSSLFYNTVTNLVKFKTGGSVSAYNLTLPLGITNNNATYIWAHIIQTFNGIGYIGLALWVDKGIKVLVPNGLNSDCSLNNIEYTQANFNINVFNSMGNGQKILRLAPSVEILSYDSMTAEYYDANTNYNRLTSDSSIATSSAFIGKFTVVSNVITNFSVNPVLNINSMCDGQWVDSSLTLASGVTYPKTTDTEYDLTSYLPADGYNYEVLVNGTVTTGTTSGNAIAIRLKSSIITSYSYICNTTTRTNGSATGSGVMLIPVGSDRKITVVAYSTYVGSYSLFVRGYRRIGTNS